MEVKAGYKQTEVGVIPEDWDVKQLKDVVSKVIDNRGKTPPYKDNGDIELIETASISFVTQYPDYSKITKFVSNETYKNWFRAHPTKDDVLISTVGEYSGSSAIMGADRGTVAQNLVALRIKEVLPAYVFHWTRSGNFKSQLDQVMMNQAQPSLRVPWLLNFNLSTPSNKAEQEAIADALSDADALIEALEGLIAKKRQVKQGAMSELLSGKKRLPGFGKKWEIKSLGELGSTFGGLTGKTKSDFGRGTSSFITFMNIMSNVVIDCKTFELVDIKPTETQNRVKKGDLFFNGSSETPEEVGMCAVLMEDVQDVFLNSFCFGYRFREDAEVNGLYFAYYFRSQEGRELMKSLAQGATRYNLSKTALLRLSFPLPDQTEQIAIAEILSDMDAEISALEEKLSKARQVKAGMMSELLTGRIRLIDKSG